MYAFGGGSNRYRCGSVPLDAEIHGAFDKMSSCEIYTHGGLIITVSACMYECLETRQKWHRAAVPTYYGIRFLLLSLSLARARSSFLFLSLHVLPSHALFLFHLIFFSHISCVLRR